MSVRQHHRPSVGVTFGFTLIEMLIVVAIVGVVAAIAYPSYTEYVTTARRGVAQTALLDVLRLQRHHYVERREYATLSALGYASDTVGVASGDRLGAAGSGLYDLSVVIDPDVGGFTAQAVATGPQAADSDCPVLSIDAEARRSPAAHCW